MVSFKRDYRAYELAELDGSLLRDYQDGSHLKLFFSCEPLSSIDSPQPITEPPPSVQTNIYPNLKEWEVTDIVGNHTLLNSQRQYRVHWRDCDKLTWEPVANLDDCTTLIEEYHQMKKRHSHPSSIPY
jgi:hypothetical protein